MRAAGRKKRRTGFRSVPSLWVPAEHAAFRFRSPVWAAAGLPVTLAVKSSPHLLHCSRVSAPVPSVSGALRNIFQGLVVLPEMSLVIRNLQRVISIRRVPLRKKIEIVRSVLGVQKFDLGIICVDNKNIQHLNRIYREKNAPTDVLSFPFHENLKPGEILRPDFPDDYNLGDIFLGVEYICQQCKEDEDYEDILTVTATHGLCHLLGFTHSTEAEWLKMLQKEKLALDELNRHTGTRLQPLSRDLF
ncbi:endoribonuclease YbeY isoform X2 [Otolemur garnettii]|uniref:endoribonuclease YbeY isoform X2 n=1 Tax=Otolemur garnettii TaxID=30611 RepID=UPI000274208B|nr:endoribonuclease YbeY isoform X2 [Otolemur garnettii]